MLGAGGFVAPARQKAAALVVGGINPTFAFVPEIDPMNYLARVTVSVLMLNGDPGAESFFGRSAGRSRSR